jgi:hypothetical protein
MDTASLTSSASASASSVAYSEDGEVCLYERDFEDEYEEVWVNEDEIEEGWEILI